MNADTLVDLVNTLVYLAFMAALVGSLVARALSDAVVQATHWFSRRRKPVSAAELEWRAQYLRKRAASLQIRAEKKRLEAV